ncbi:unnamed protein product [Rotaria socialis]|uniref:Uncharacterized protein n=1 Tax=Rotaria socialis TaxID=392032 RepID=A0A818H063_9BILA|nr:unnamed protein product [Rotaria socialis]CAF4472920.1 unnamed protein product [Rotaria socialis]
MLIGLLLPNRLLVNFIEKSFNIIQSDKQQLMMNFYGIEISFLASRRFRVSLIFQLVAIIWIVSLVLIDVCVFQVMQLSAGSFCPQQRSDCFNFNNIQSNERIDCEPGEKLMNLTTPKAVCFIWVYKEITAIAMLNQIGIASSVFSLMCYGFKLCCCLSRKWLGLVVIILLALGGITIMLLTFTVTIYLSMTGLFLVIGLCAICINVIQLFQFASHHQRKTQTTNN